MERFFNIIYYFAYRADCKATWWFYKYTGLIKLYKLPFLKKRFEKMGIKDPVAGLMNIWERPDFGLSTIVASGLIGGGHFLFLLGLHIYLKIPVHLGLSDKPDLYLVISYGVIVYLLNYILIWHKDKWLKYFKEFDKKPREWKVKWSWISFGMIIFPFAFFFWSILRLPWTV